MLSLQHIFRRHYLCLKVGFLVLVLSAEASLLQRRINASIEPVYLCNNKRILFSDVETTRKAACRGFIVARDDARRPLVYIEDEDNENLIYEWSLPIRLKNYPNYKGKKSIGKIIFNNRCELVNVLCHDRYLNQFKVSKKVPDIPTGTTWGADQVTTKPFVQCGSLSWETEEIQKVARRKLSSSKHDFVEMESTYSRFDGPWKSASFIKKTSKYYGPLRVRYEIVVNNQNEVRGIVLTHHVSRKIAIAKNNEEGSDRSHFDIKLDKQTIRLVCVFERTFPLLPNKTPNVLNPLKRKTPQKAKED